MSLIEKLKSLNLKSDLRERFFVYQEVLSELAEVNSVLSPLLLRLKEGYEEMGAACFDPGLLQELSIARRECKSLQGQLRHEKKQKEVLAEETAKLKKDTQSYMIKISELTAVCRSRDKQLRDQCSSQTRPSHLTEMVKTLQMEVQLLKTRETFLLSAAGQKQALGKFSHKKSHSTLPKMGFFESQPIPGTISPFFRDANGFSWDGSTIEAKKRPVEDISNLFGL